MSSMMKLVCCLVILASQSFVGGIAEAKDRSVAIVNNGDTPIRKVFIGHKDEANWRVNLLGKNTIPVGGSARVKPKPSRHCRFDVMVVFKDGHDKLLQNVNLCETTKIVVSEDRYRHKPRPPTSPTDAPKPIPVPHKLPPIISAEVVTSRTFVGPDPLPPKGIGAFGIVAFPARMTPESEVRALLVCHAYWATLPEASELDAPPEMQMVTVWPVNANSLAAKLRERRDVGVCDDAVHQYHLPTALLALRHAGLASFQDRGPYLLAWAPPSTKGQPGVFVLQANLSSATTFDQFSEHFRKWRGDIEQRPELWDKGWSIDGVQFTIRDWADTWGTRILTIAIGEE